MTNQFRPVPWQRNLRIIPHAVRAKLDAAPDAEFVAGVVKAVPLAAIQAGRFTHLGIKVVNGEVSNPARSRPPAEMGSYSKKNREGWEVVRRDLPMITQTRSFDTPNFGDWSNGSHTVEVDRDVYQRDYFDPLDSDIIVEKLRVGSNGEIVFKFLVDFPLDRKLQNFEEDLLFALNLLQENLGTSDVLPRDANRDDLLSTLELDWEIFPPGTVDEVVRRTIGRLGRASPEQEALVRERIQLFSKLKPKKHIHGRGGLNRYIGALFADDLVVFENIHYGNALYVLYQDWAQVSQRSRVDLLKCRDVRFERFVHCEGWIERFTNHIRAEKRRRGIHDDLPGSSRAA